MVNGRKWPLALLLIESTAMADSTIKQDASLDSGRHVFFFQAEDGIRDYKVTGVQTCALPISLLDIVLLRYVGMQPVLVHGGGPEISAMSERLGLKPEFKNGLRITDEKTMEVVKMVLTGKVSPDLVAAIHRLGGQAVGMSGEDGPTIIAEPLDDTMGFVGKGTQVNKEPITALLTRGYIPVIASIGLGYDGHPYNIHAHTVAAQIAVALNAA